MAELRPKWAVAFNDYCDIADDLQAALDLTFERIDSTLREADGNTQRTIEVHQNSVWCDGEEDETGDCLCGMPHDTPWVMLDPGVATKHRVLVLWVDGHASFTVEGLPDV